MASFRKHFHSHSLTKRLQQLSSDRSKDSQTDLKSLRAQICCYDQQLRQLEADRTNLRSISPAPAGNSRRKSGHNSPGKAKLRAPRPKSSMALSKKPRHKSHDSLPFAREPVAQSEAKEIQTSLPDEELVASFQTFGTKKPDEPSVSQEADVSRGNTTIEDDSLQPYISFPQQLRKPTKSASMEQPELNSTVLGDDSAELLGLMTDQGEPPAEPSITPQKNEGVRESSVLRASFEQSLVYQDSLYKEIERIKDLFEGEKARWKQQIKRLKDEQQLEVEEIKNAYEDKLRTYRDQEAKERLSTYREHEFGKMLEACEKEKHELRATLEAQHKLSLDLTREQLRTQFQQELESYKQQLSHKRDEEENFLQEQLLQRLQLNESRIRAQVQQELEDQYHKERATRDREYELILKARVSALKTDYERKVKDLQDQMHAMRREDKTGKRTALEELAVGKTKENSPALCSKCSALLAVSQELVEKRSKLRSIVES